VVGARDLHELERARGLEASRLRRHSVLDLAPLGHLSEFAALTPPLLLLPRWRSVVGVCPAAYGIAPPTSRALRAAARACGPLTSGTPATPLARLLRAGLRPPPADAGQTLEVVTLVRPRRRSWTFQTLDTSVAYALTWDRALHRWEVTPMTDHDGGAPRLAFAPPSAPASGTRAQRGGEDDAPEARRVGRHRVVADTGWVPIWDLT